MNLYCSEIENKLIAFSKGQTIPLATELIDKINLAKNKIKELNDNELPSIDEIENLKKLLYAVNVGARFINDNNEKTEEIKKRKELLQLLLK